MAKYHVNPKTGNPGRCSASEGNCPFGEDAIHYDSVEAAREGFENQQKLDLLTSFVSRGEEENSIADMIENTLNFDPLGGAEKITGKSYKDDEETAALGMLLHMSHNKKKQALLKDSNDTHYNISFDETLAIYKELGFEEAYSETFKSTAWYPDSEVVDEQYKVLWNPDGVLATVESYNGARVNNTKIYYNWRPNDTKNFWQHTSSGHLTDGDVWAGYHDVRDGLKHTLSQLRAHGEFLPTWEERPWFWLVNYSDERNKTDDSDYFTKVKEDKFNKIPANIREHLGTEK